MAVRTEGIDDDFADTRDGLVPFNLRVSQLWVGGSLDGLELRKGDVAIHGLTAALSSARRMRRGPFVLAEWRTVYCVAQNAL